VDFKGCGSLGIPSLDKVSWHKESDELAQEFCRFIYSLLWHETSRIEDVIIASVDSFFLSRNICSVKSLQSAREHMERIDWKFVKEQYWANGPRTVIHERVIEQERQLVEFSNGLTYMAIGWIEEEHSFHAHGEMLLEKFWKKGDDNEKHPV
jgi:hypothetical protein